MTGVALAAGALMLVWWLIAAASGPEAFAVARDFNGSWLGRVLLFGWNFALFYHLCNGIRHLFWDTGRGFELPALVRSGWAVIISAVVLTVIAWIWGHAAMGAL